MMILSKILSREFCLQELPKILTWFLSRILSRDLVSILLARITQDSDMILLKLTCKSCKHDYDNILDKIHDKNHVSNLSNSYKQDTKRFLDKIIAKYYTRRSLTRMISESWVILASKILTRSLDKIFDKNHVSNLGNSYKQDTNKVPWQDPWQESCQNLG